MALSVDPHGYGTRDFADDPLVSGRNIFMLVVPGGRDFRRAKVTSESPPG